MLKTVRKTFSYVVLVLLMLKYLLHLLFISEKSTNFGKYGHIKRESWGSFRKRIRRFGNTIKVGNEDSQIYIRKFQRQ